MPHASATRFEMKIVLCSLRAATATSRVRLFSLGRRPRSARLKRRATVA